jgi:ribonuclease P protein component
MAPCLRVCFVILVADHRLRQNSDFQRVRQTGRSWSNRWLVLSAAPNGLPHSRIGYAIGKRLGGAVARNRLKRQLREILRARLAAGQVPAGYDLVIIARAPAAEADWETLNQAVNLLLRGLPS